MKPIWFEIELLILAPMSHLGAGSCCNTITTITILAWKRGMELGSCCKLNIPFSFYCFPDFLSCIRFSACWTTVTAAAYTILFIDPTWSTHPVASVGAQGIWVLFTWLLWIVSSGMINASVPSLLVKARCAGVAYCLQIQLMFGK